jgi:nitric oxide synthase-interacting protein
MRLGADSFKDFDACALCLHPAVEPLGELLSLVVDVYINDVRAIIVCPKGHLFCKGCIYQSLMAQKQHKKKQLEKYNEQLAEAKNEATRDEKESKVKEVSDFEKLESGVISADSHVFGPKIDIAKDLVPAGYEAYQTAEGKVYVINKELVKTHRVSTEQLTKDQREQRKKYMPCFWIPNVCDAVLPFPSILHHADTN